MDVQIIDTKTDKTVATIPVSVNGQRRIPSELDFFAEAWRCAVVDRSVDASRRDEYLLRMMPPFRSHDHMVHSMKAKNGMTSSNGEASGLHYRAAVIHEAAAVLHRKAAELHAVNKTEDARACSRAALDSSGRAQGMTIAACDSSGE